jgi:hypothetical protein
MGVMEIAVVLMAVLTEMEGRMHSRVVMAPEVEVVFIPMVLEMVRMVGNLVMDL